MNTSDRNIRVFISSTFRDMQAERDHLVNFIFPQLSRLCRSRGVTWGEVDLRWGVTDEQAAEGKVLPICLEEIKRCRPYFIGMLGERYGWIPETVSADLLEREPWLQEHLQGKTSVTELEILHGVLRDPKMAGYAYFYFRDPKYLETLAESEMADYVAETEREAEKLRNLKDTIRRSGFPVREGYSGSKQLGELVLADLTEVINDLFPEGSQPDALDREATLHETYAQSRGRVYIAREEYFDALSAHASGNDPQPLVVLGETGSGKSALIANWAARYRQTHPDATVLQHYIGATPDSTNLAAMLRRFMGEFKRRFGIQDDIPEQTEALQRAFPIWLSMAAAKGRAVLVLDALNQLEDREGAPDLAWLPFLLPENIRLILSTLPGRSLDEITKREWPTLEVGLLSPDDRRNLIAEYLSLHAKSLSLARVDRIATAQQSANALYLCVLLDELRLVPRHEELEERIADYLRAQSSYELYQRVILRWEQVFGQELVRQSLGLIWVSRRGLSEEELRRLLGKDGQPLPFAIWGPFYLAAESSLTYSAGLLAFSNNSIRRAVFDCTPVRVASGNECRRRLVGYFALQDINERTVEELPWQLHALREWQKLSSLLADSSFLSQAWQHQRFDVTRYWADIEAESPLRAEGYYPLTRSALTGAAHVVEIEAAILAMLGHVTPACQRLQQLVEQWHELNEHTEELRCLRLLAAWHLQAHRYVAARDSAKRLEDLAQEADATTAVVAALEIQSEVLRKTAETPHRRRDRGSLGREAGLIEQRAIRISRQAGLKADLARLLGRRLSQRIALMTVNSLMTVRGQSLLGAIFGLRATFTEGLQDSYETERVEFEAVCRELNDAGGLLLALRARSGLIGKLFSEGDQERDELLQQQLQLSRQVGDERRIGELLGEMAEYLPVDLCLAKLKEQEVHWRRIGYRSGLVKTLLAQADFLFDTQGDRLRAQAKYAEASALLDALPDRMSRLLAQVQRLKFALNVTEARQQKLAGVAFCVLAILGGTSGCLLWRWANHAASVWSAITLAVRLFAIALFFPTVLLIVSGGEKLWQFLRKLVRRRPAECQGASGPALPVEHPGALANLNEDAFILESKENNITDIVSRREPEAGKRVATSEGAGELPDRMSELLLSVFRIYGRLNRRFRWQRRVIARLRFETWAWQLLWCGVVGTLGWMLMRFTTIVSGAWWLRAVVEPLRLFSQLLILQTAGVLISHLVRQSRWKDRFMVASPTINQIQACFFYEIVLMIALSPVRLRRLFKHRQH
jgi:hypothetical protein